MNASWTTTHLIDAAHGTAYQARLKAFVQHVQSYNLTVGGAMQGRKRERNSQLQSLISRPFSTRFG